ncbi:SCO2322 family protein [Streptomyces sp. H10-C2]|uniref:SCO2322 family protein n=1 Tax=unclassified Streptomyces TaxID=2593676 RepID=UPI0024B945EB|nr:MULTISPECIES: SCO2322 family protein [unclassified Streptomyces]MDJ0347026.1 SCO2322 family protein [Streptomyces sp. PH10-H1]MDJ0372420.1 SCO2322 family protein [Streptomyces sp. H10-C2]
MPRPRLRALAVLLTLGAFLAVTALPAQAAAYRYWSFWQRSASGDTWTYAQTGPALDRPGDGAVEGWRFAASAEAQDASKPRDVPGATSFAAICAGTPAEAGSKRVALVLDFGTAADAGGGQTPPAPRTACARVPGDATGADALAAVAKPLRYNSSGMVCAVAGYPRTGCGEPVSSDTGTKTKTPAPQASGDAGASGGSGGSTSLGVFAGIAAVLALGGAAVWQARRRRG